jgi:hypothetical protein
MTLNKLFKQARTSFDLTKSTHLEGLDQLVSALENAADLQEIKSLAHQQDAPLEFRLAAKLVESRQSLARLKEPLKLGIVFAMWGEQNRLKPKSAENPNGEDSLRVKLDQLQRISEGTPLQWTLYAVDDGCPHGSAKLARECAESHPQKGSLRVLELGQAIPAESGPLKDLKDVNHSRKAGAVILGAMTALEEGADVVMYTDADNSVHLGQIGILLAPYLERGCRVVLGNRKDPESVLVKQESRWGVGIKVLRHMQRMIGKAVFSKGILDTQAAFKLYHKDVLAKILESPTVYDFSFDTDWILAVLKSNEPFEKVPFAFIDSFAESASITQGPMTTWEMLLKGLTKEVRKHEVDHNKEMALVLDQEIESYKDLEILLDSLPPQLENATDAQLGDPGVMSPSEVRAWIQERKQACGASPSV